MVEDEIRETIFRTYVAEMSGVISRLIACIGGMDWEPPSYSEMIGTVKKDERSAQQIKDKLLKKLTA